MSLKKSPWIIDYDVGGCNGCNLEMLAILTPRYDMERFGAIYKTSPKNADILLVQGCLNKKALPRVKKILSQMAEKKIVVAIGSCAISGGPFKDAYNVIAPLDKHIHVDVYVPGCPPRPEAIMDGIIKALKMVKE
ncbi:MAG: NADH-quinone oxidoreductase subunit NuoB [archaeon]